MKKVIMYTDGGCRGNPGVGGWGVLLKCEKSTKKLKGSKEHTTNNRMELTAAIEGLLALKKTIPVEIHTDSTYVKNGITQWIKNWKVKGWVNASRQPVKNKDLWQKLDELVQQHNVSWFWVKGHSGHPGNDMADLLANQAMDEFIATNGKVKA